MIRYVSIFSRILAEIFIFGHIPQISFKFAPIFVLSLILSLKTR